MLLFTISSHNYDSSLNYWLFRVVFFTQYFVTLLFSVSLLILMGIPNDVKIFLIFYKRKIQSRCLFLCKIRDRDNCDLLHKNFFSRFNPNFLRSIWKNILEQSTQFVWWSSLPLGRVFKIKFNVICFTYNINNV